MTAQIIPVAVFDLVVFGATGDLAHAQAAAGPLSARQATGRCPRAAASSASPRSQLTHADYVAQVEAACRRYLQQGRVRRDGARSVSAPADHLRRRSTPPRRNGWAELRRARWAAGTRTGPRLFYLATSPDLFGPICERLPVPAGIVTPQVPRRAGKADRPRPRLGDPDQRRGRPGLRRGAGLPHRPLSRQGDGPEPAGAALRQLAVRAGLEPRRTSTTSRSPWPRPSASRGAAAYYDKSGALRDMVQNHMLQLLCLVAMEPPTSMAADAVRDEKLKVLRSLQADRRRRGAAARPCAASTGPAPAAAWRRAGLCRGAGRRASQHRDLRGAQGRDRELALGRRAVLPAHRQAPADPGVGDRHPVPRGAALDLPARRRASSSPTG